MKSNCKTKSAMTALVVAAMLCTAAMPVKAAESQWVNSNGTWTYVKADGSKATGWIKEDGCWYAFDANGAMRTGWIASNEHWYFMGESGVMQSDAWVEDNGAKYYIKGTGVMAKDYVKDGYELTSEGKAIPLGESGSVVVTDPAELEGKVIEGNLYVDVTTAKELELKGVTVKGKLVIIGDNETAGKVTLTDSTVETINTQSRNAEVVLSGKTEVKNVVIEETAKVTPDKNYKGEVENIEVQSTTKGEVVIEVAAENVSTRTYATVDVQAPVGNLEVKTDTQVKVNADVKNVTVTETAKDTTVEVAKGSTVGTITADAPVKIDGKGTVEKVEANVDGVEAGKDTVIKDVETGKDVTEAPDVTKPDKGGSSGGSGGGDYTPTPSYDYLAKTEDELIEYLNKATDGQVIRLNNDIVATKKIQVVNDASFTLDGNNKTITGVNTVGWNGEYVLQLYNNAKQITVKNLTLTGGDAGLLVNGANVKLEGTINVSGNEFGGIEVSQGEGVTNLATLDIKDAKLVNTSEAINNPVIWTIGNNSTITNASLVSKPISDSKIHYLTNEAAAATYNIVNEADFAFINRNESDIETYRLMNDIVINDQINIESNKEFTLDGNDHVITKNGEKTEWQGHNAYILHFWNNESTVIVKNIKLTGSNAAMLINGANVKLEGTIDVSGNGFGGIELSKGKDVGKDSELDITAAEIINNSEAKNNPTIWMDNYTEDQNSLSLTGKEKLFEQFYTEGGKDQMLYYLAEITVKDPKMEIVVKDNQDKVENPIANDPATSEPQIEENTEE